MILYFADRRFNILDHASTSLPKGLIIAEDNKIEDVETGVATFECKIPFDSKTRERVKDCTEVGNFILRSHNDENEYFTIIDHEWDEKNCEVYIYAEDAGLDLLNEIVGAYVATEARPISYYIEKFAYDSGFEIGTNEIANLTRKLSWDGEDTITARLASVATQFDNAEISYSFEVKGLKVTKKYINIHKKRGRDAGVKLHMNKEIDNIVTSKSIANVATALRVIGGIPEEAENPITLDGYKYDDGDFFLDGTYLKSRKAHAVWSRYLAESGTYTGHICKRFEYDTTSQEELLNRAIEELKKVREIEVNYKIDITSLPENVRIGDRVNVIDDANELYVSARILVLETSVVNGTQTATIGEHLIKGSGISQKVADLASQFAIEAAEIKKSHQEALEAQKKAEEAKQKADDAQQTANTANSTADTAKNNAATAQSTADTAKTNAATAQSTADTARTEAANAAKTATNFLNFDSDGLQVGNKTSGSWSGYRARILPKSFDILDENGNVLASYGANKVELGKNNEDSVIELCGGKGAIQMDSAKEFLQFKGEFVQMASEGIITGVAYNPDGSVDEYEVESFAGVDTSYINGGVRGFRGARMFAYYKDVNDENDAGGSWVDVQNGHATIENYVGNYEVYSGATFRGGHADIEADEYVQVTAPFMTVYGDLAVSGGLSIGGNNVDDYVVETGTSGIWTYRKWNSGIAECWGTATYSTSFDQAYTWLGGTAYICLEKSTSFPSGLFKSTPKCFVQYQNAVKDGTAYASFAYPSGTSATSSKTTAMRVMRIGGSVAGVTLTFDYYAFGTWK